MKKEILRIEHLKQYFGKNKDIIKAVDDVTLEVYKGEVLGLVGESGCGKTTIAKAVMGLYNLTEGKIYYDGKILNKKNRTSDIQMVFQDPMESLNPRMTVREIVAEGLIIKGDKKNLDARVYEVLELVGLTKEHAGRYPHEFSGGQRQRICIARAIIMNPSVIIADEPVSALDVSIQAQIINLLNDLKERMKLTIIFIAHDLSVVKHFSDRVAVMYRGKIIEMADTDTLFNNPQHSYTKTLLSSIPYPDPVYERNRQRKIFTESEKE